MRRTLIVVALVGLTVTAGCSSFAGTSNPSGGVQAHTQAGESGATGRTVAVSARGQVQSVPNKAIIRVAVSARADSIEAVRQELARNASRLRAALEAAGLDAEQIVSTGYELGRNYEREERPGAPKYRGQHSFAITVNDTARTGEIIVTAVQNGATNVEEVRFTISQQTRRTLRQRALAVAVDNAKSKASVMANGTGLTLRGVRTVRTADVSVDPIEDRKVALAAAGDTGGSSPLTSLERGKVTVAVQVVVVYNATSP